MPDYPKLRLSTIAKLINEKLPEFRAEIVEGYCDTDRKIGRLRHPGKGRYGNRLQVFNKHGRKVIDHNAAVTYRTNEEVLQTIEKFWGRIWEKDTKPSRPPKCVPKACGCCACCLAGNSRACPALDECNKRERSQ